MYDFVFFPLLDISLTIFQARCYFNKAHAEGRVTFKLLEELNIPDALPVCLRMLVSTLIRNVNPAEEAGCVKHGTDPPSVSVSFVLVGEGAVCCCEYMKGFVGFVIFIFLESCFLTMFIMLKALCN